MSFVDIVHSVRGDRICLDSPNNLAQEAYRIICWFYINGAMTE